MNPDKHIIDRWRNSEILLLGGSAGSFKVIFESVNALPAALDKTVVVIMHRGKNYTSEVSRMFSADCALPVREVSDKEPVQHGTVFIAPSNYHTLFEKNGLFALDVSDSVWFSKPAIDVTFESAAECFGDKCTVVLFSGANPDGAQGMLKLKQAGSLTIAQDPDEAEIREMPQAAIAAGAAELVLTTAQLLQLLKS